MRLYSAKNMVETAQKEGYAIPALNANGANYDISRAILEAAAELRSPMIIQAYDPNLEYRGYDFFVQQVKFLAQDLDIPICISLDHGKSIESVMKAARAGFTHIMFDYAAHPIDENIEKTNLVAGLLHPLGISVEAEIGDIFISNDASKQAPVTPISDIEEFVSRTSIDCLAAGVGTTHGIFQSQTGIDFCHIKEIKKTIELPIVLHGTSGVSHEDISHCVKCGMSKVNFGEILRINYIRYFNEMSVSIDHEHHTWKIMRAVKDKLKEDIKDIIRAVGSDGRVPKHQESY